jgi:hypothetical protein
MLLPVNGRPPFIVIDRIARMTRFVSFDPFVPFVSSAR